MRTTAEARRSPAPPARDTATSPRRGRAAGQAPAASPPASPAPAAPPPAPAAAEQAPVAVTAVRVLPVAAGLYVLRIGPLPGALGEVAGMALPAAHLSVPTTADGNAPEIVAAFPRPGPWVGREGGTAILRSARGGVVVVTVYGAAGSPDGAAPPIELQRLDGPAGAAAGVNATPAAAAAPAAVPPVTGEGGREVPAEMLLHIERAGDRLFPARGWVGALGRQMRIEAFSMRPLERLMPADIEMKGFLPNGGETAWVPGGVLCGTRGRGLPLIGFAIRMAPHQAHQYDVIYQGSFFAGGISEARSNGDPCRSGTVDDPLEAINVRIVERGAAADGNPG